jgi:hypothetical protein
MKMFSKNAVSIAAILITVLIGAVAPQNSRAQAPPGVSATLPSDIAPGSPLAQVIQLAQSGVDQSVIIGYINNSGSPFNLTSDQIIYLKDIGLPNNAVTAMLARDQQLGAATAAQPPPSADPTAFATEPPPEATQVYFYDTLAPYGGWVNVSGYGLCWRPSVVIYNANWRPYCDHGHWVYTDCGWYWASDYSWGATTFHYGRWFYYPGMGWCWWPDTVWAPSWVCWRYSNSYCGWAPLPPNAIYRPGIGMVYNGVTIYAGFNFGIGVNLFTFVPTQNFCSSHPSRYRVPMAQVTQVYNQTTVINNYNVKNNIIVNNGIPARHIARVTGLQIHPVTLAMRGAYTPGAHPEQIGHDTLIVNRPRFSGESLAPLRQGIAPHPNVSNRYGNSPVPHVNTPSQYTYPPPNHGYATPQTPYPHDNDEKSGSTSSKQSDNNKNQNGQP